MGKRADLQEVRPVSYPAKILPPRPRGFVVRERLFEKLDRHDGLVALWASGPAGSGKTVLASSYAIARGLPCLWYQIDAADADLASFFHFLGTAACKAAPRRNLGLPVFTPDWTFGIPQFGRTWFTEFFVRLRRPCLMVFDNAHEVPDEHPLFDVLRAGALVAPPGTRVLLLSRNAPPPALAGPLAAGELDLLGWDDLRFTPEEIRAWLLAEGFEGVPPEGVEWVRERTGGWAAGVRLLLRAARERETEPHLLGDDLPAEIFQYLGSEVFARAEPGVRDFLLKTSLLPTMTASMAASLTGRRDAGRLLSRLHRGNLFTERRPGPAPAYQYHPLFREFLLERLRQSLDETGRAHLERRAAMLLAEAQQPEAAADLLSAAKDWPGLAALCLREAPALAAQGRTQTLAAWLDRLPSEVSAANPWFGYWLGVCRMVRDPLGAREHFGRALDRFRIASDPTGAYLAWAGAVGCTFYALHDYRSLDRWMEALKCLEDEVGPIPAGNVETRVVESMYLALVMRQPSAPEFEVWEERAVNLARAGSDPALTLAILTSRTCHRLHSGRHVEACATLSELLGLCRGRALPPLAAITIKAIQTVWHMFRAEADECAQVLKEALQLSADTGARMMDRAFYGNAAWAAFASGDGKTGRKLLAAMEACPPGAGTWDTACLKHMKAFEALWAGRPAEALGLIETAIPLAEDAGVPFSEAMCRLLASRACLELNEAAGGQEHLEVARRIADETRNDHIAFACLLTEASFALQDGRRADGLKALRQALALGKARDLADWYPWRPATVVRVLAFALQQGIETQYVQDLIRRHRLLPEKPPVEVEAWPWPIRIYTLGRFELVRDGSPVRSESKAQQKPLALLKALLAFGGRRVSEDLVRDALWPDATGDLQRQALYTATHRLRQLLGHGEALQTGDSGLGLDARYCWVDAWAFQRLTGHASAGRDPQALERAAALYRGPFLGGDSAHPWTVAMRESLRTRFLRAVSDLGQQWEALGAWNRAADAYRRGLEVDPLAEELYRKLMGCLARLGQRAEALAAYRRCRHVLAKALDIAPALETEALCRRIEKEGKP